MYIVDHLLGARRVSNYMTLECLLAVDNIQLNMLEYHIVHFKSLSQGKLPKGKCTSKLVLNEWIYNFN